MPIMIAIAANVLRNLFRDRARTASRKKRLTIIALQSNSPRTKTRTWPERFSFSLLVLVCRSRAGAEQPRRVAIDARGGSKLPQARGPLAEHLRARIVRAALLIALLGCAHGPRSVVLPTLSGQEVRLADLRGRVVLLDFWATWCEPCKLSLPFYARLQRELRGLEVVAASTDEDDEDVRKFLAQTPLPYTIARDPAGRIADELGVELMPTTFLLDRAGNVRFRHVGAAPDSEAALRREVQQLLAE